MTFIKTSLAVSLGVAALCLSAQAGAARTAPDFATVVKADVALQAAVSASAPRQMFAGRLHPAKPPKPKP